MVSLPPFHKAQFLQIWLQLSNGKDAWPRIGFWEVNEFRRKHVVIKINFEQCFALWKVVENTLSGNSSTGTGSGNMVRTHRGNGPPLVQNHQASSIFQPKGVFVTRICSMSHMTNSDLLILLYLLWGIESVSRYHPMEILFGHSPWL